MVSPYPQVLELSAAHLSVFFQLSSMHHQASGVTMTLGEVAGGNTVMVKCCTFQRDIGRVLLFVELITTHHN